MGRNVKSGVLVRVQAAIRSSAVIHIFSPLILTRGGYGHQWDKVRVEKYIYMSVGMWVCMCVILFID